MKRFLKVLAACVMASLCVSVPGVQNPKAKRSKSPPIVYTGKSDIKVTDELMAQFLKFMQLRAVLFTPPTTCVLQSGGVCVIEVPIILVSDSGGTQYCVGLFPEKVSLAATATGNPEKTIVWSLIPPSSAPAGATFTFFDDSGALSKAPGIIILSDIKKQMHNGALGDGTTTPPDATKYLIKNKHKLKGEAVYIPIIVRTDNAGTPSEKVSVCGTPDPRIAND